MGWAFSAYGGEGYTGFFVGKHKGKNHLEDPGVDGRIMKWTFRKSVLGDMDWIDLAQDRDRWVP